MKRSIICAILFLLAGIFYLAAAIKGNIPIYYIFGVILILLGGLYIVRAVIEKKELEEEKAKAKEKPVKTIKVNNKKAKIKKAEVEPVKKDKKK